jgi:hypothetical protein
MKATLERLVMWTFSEGGDWSRACASIHQL